MNEAAATLTEAIFCHRQILLEGYFAVGKLVLEHNLSVEEVAFHCKQRPKTIHYAKELARLYPDLNGLPEGKNISWYKITKTLPPYEKDQPKKKK